MNEKIVYEDKCNMLLDFVAKHGRLPTRKENGSIRLFIDLLRHRFNKNELDESKINTLRITGIFENLLKERQEARYNNLLLFRKQNPDRWPSQKSNDINEKSIANWCATLKNRYHLKILNKKWIDKLNAIGFDLTMNEIRSEWLINFEAVKLHFETNESTKGLSLRLRNWCRFQFNKYHDNDTKSPYVQLLDAINFFQYVRGKKSWEENYLEIKDFINQNNKRPTIKSNRILFYWWSSQQNIYRKRLLPIERIKLLKKLHLDVKIRREDYETTWNRNYENVKSFIENNHGRWPFSRIKGPERSLYIWCQEQRKIKSCIEKGLKKENKEHTRKLTEIGFKWSIKIVNDERWKNMLQNVKVHLKGSKNIPQYIEGKTNPLYSWITTQKNRIKTSTITEDRKARFLAVIQ